MTFSTPTITLPDHSPFKLTFTPTDHQVFSLSQCCSSLANTDEETEEKGHIDDQTISTFKTMFLYWLLRAERQSRDSPLRSE
jgi:hypothetical protein